MQIYNQNENLWLDNYNCKTISYHRLIILLEVIFFFLPYAEILYLHGGWNASLCELEQIVTLVINRVRTMVEWTGKIKCLSLYLCSFLKIWNNILNIWMDGHIYFLSLSSIGILKVWSRDQFSRYLISSKYMTTKLSQVCSLCFCITNILVLYSPRFLFLFGFFYYL